ncbi:MAG: ABC transporter permease, partial [Bacteroidota bacterium]
MSQRTEHQPPSIPSWLLTKFAGSADIEDLLGDLEEGFEELAREKGLFRARVHHWRHVLSLCFSYALRSRRHATSYSPYYSSGGFGMFRNYVKIASRNFWKHKLFTVLNLLGLALGMSVCLLALSTSVAIVQSDEFHDNKDRIYQINTVIHDEEGKSTYASTFPAVGPHMESEYPFVEAALEIRPGFRPQVHRHGNLLDFHGYYVDPKFFDAFSFDLLQGDPSSALKAPQTMVLTKSVADKLFRDQDPMGQTLDTEEGSFTVTGVMADLKQTHMYFEVLTSQRTIARNTTPRADDWQQHRGHYLYLLLRPGTTAETLAEALGQTAEIASGHNAEIGISLASAVLDQVVPRWNIRQAMGIGWDYPSMIFFLFIGFVILVPAVFNYTNLSIARAMKRAKEVGIRKVVGAGKRQIKMQFIVETVIMTLLALIGSVFIFIPIQKEFFTMVRAAEVLDTTLNGPVVVVFVSFAVFVGLMAGLFPAVYFSKISPAHSLKGALSGRAASVSGIKKGLFVFQFALSMFFIIGIATMARQYRHVFNDNHGFQSAQVVTLPFLGQNKQVAMEALKSHPDVTAITSSSHLPGVVINTQVEITPNTLDTINVAEVFMGEHFVSQLEMKLLWGSEELGTNSTQNEERVLVNERFLQAIAVFEQSEDSLTFTMGDGTHARIQGVLQDLHFEPLSRDIKPMVFRYSVDESNYALLSVQSQDFQATLVDLERIWSGIDQEVPFEASFLDDEIKKAYYFLRAQIKIFTFLGTLAVVISCLGLLGMVSYTTENRTKEIAIRKIMGASVSGIHLLLARDFLRLIGYSALIAVPLSYFFYDKLFLYFLIRYGLGV